MSNETDILQNIPDSKPVRIFIPLLNNPDRFKAQCVYQQSVAPKFTLIFKPGVLPTDDIDTNKSAIINVDMGGPTISLEANIVEISNSQTLEMLIQKSISHEQMREFFRVDAVTDVISNAFETAVLADKEQESVAGKTVDISGSGILAIFESMPPQTKHIQLEISLPGEDIETIKIFAHQVRIQKLHDGRFEAAYHFDDISVENRDAIIGTCLVLQRKMLRLKVQVRDNQ